MKTVFDADRQVQYQLSRKSGATRVADARQQTQIASQIETKVLRFHNRACCLSALTMASVLP